MQSGKKLVSENTIRSWVWARCNWYTPFQSRKNNSVLWSLSMFLKNNPSTFDATVRVKHMLKFHHITYYDPRAPHLKINHITNDKIFFIPLRNINRSKPIHMYHFKYKFLQGLYFVKEFVLESQTLIWRRHTTRLN